MFKTISKGSVAALLALALVVPASSVYSQTQDDNEASRVPEHAQQGNRGHGSNPNLQVQSQDRGGQDIGNDRRCRAAENNASRHMHRLSTLIHRHVDLFSTISERVDQFYTDKELDVEGYGDHMDHIHHLRQEAEEMADELVEGSAEFTCGEESVGRQVSAFREQAHEARGLLKEFRKAVVDQIVMVKTALGDDDDEEEEGESGNTNGDNDEDETNETENE